MDSSLLEVLVIQRDLGNCYGASGLEDDGKIKMIVKFEDLVLEPSPEPATMPPIFLGGKRRRSSGFQLFGRDYE
tara:strand:+ start:1497 stop:1718 length:222 start_codon:yes stop_codon:yes gene_type:complete